MRIVVDTREQDAYEFDGTETVRRKLDAGDYSIEGMEDRVAIERKSLNDFVATVIYQKDRFRKELARLSEMEFSAIVVEASLPDVLEHRYKSAVNPLSVIEAAVAIMVWFRVPIVFAGNRQLARHVTESALRKFSKNHAKNGLA